MAGNVLQAWAASGTLSWWMIVCMQIQRLKEHTQKKHADVEAAEDEGPAQEPAPAGQASCQLKTCRLLPCPPERRLASVHVLAPGQDHGR